MPEGKASIELQAKSETKATPIDHELASKIADALGAPRSTSRIVIELDWRTSVFQCLVTHYLTDDQGQVILEAIQKR